MAPPVACSQELYVSFNFPQGETPISHYNITPPENTLMTDNGDSTAFFIGSCVQGQYAFKYVYVEKNTSAKSWKHHVREGTFQIASLDAGQCEVDLNTPTGSAGLKCF
jgi:hypothetical protein